MTNSKTVIFVGSTSFSGSTMIDLALANDPNGFSCGELCFSFHPKQAHHIVPRCACGEPSCRIWSKLAVSAEEDFYPNLFRQNAQLDFAVDSSKNPFWITRQIQYLKKENINSKVLLIWKDPFEIASSFESRNQFDQWKKSWLNYHRLIISQLGSNFEAVSYKDYATDPNCLKSICSKLELPYFPNKEKYWEKQHHTLFGNRSTRRHLNAVEAGLTGGVYTDKTQLNSIYYKPPSDPELIKRVTLQISEDPIIKELHQFLKARSNGSSSKPSKALALSRAAVIARRLRRSLPTFNVLRARCRKALNLSVMPLGRFEQSTKHIVFVLPSHPSEVIGGAEYQAMLILSLLHEKTNNMHRATYLCREANMGFQHPSHQVSVLPPIPFLNRYAYFFDLPFLYRRLTQLKPSIIYNRDAGAYTAACAYYAKRKNITMVLHLAHDKDVTPMKPPFPRNFLKRIDKHLLEYGIKNATMVVAQTTEQAQLLQQCYGRKVDIIVPNAQGQIALSDPDKKTSPALVLWVANFKSFKQPEVFLELAKRFENTPTRFMMVGATNSNYRELMKEIATQSNLEYMGQLPQDKVMELFEKASVFVNTSSSEGFPNTFIQAWMASVPVISLHVNPSDTLSNGIGYCSKSIDGMESHLRLLLESRELRTTMGRVAHNYAKSNYGPSALEPLLEILINE